MRSVVSTAVSSEKELVMKPVEVGQHLRIHRRRGAGKLVFKGTRLSVETTLKRLARGKTFKEILARSPKLTRAALTEAVQLAAAALTEPYAALQETVSRLWHARRLAEIRRLEPIPVGKHLVVHPGVCFGKLTFDGTRLPVATILYFLSTGRTIPQILTGWPELTREAVVEAIQLATAALVEQQAAKAEATDEPARSGRSA
jgi:uncharacterized protein (DUF433 family)